MEVSKDPPNRVRWRVVPAAITGGFGILLMLAGLVLLAIMTCTSIIGRPLYSPGPSGFDAKGGAVVFISWACGLCLLVAGRMWWRGLWWCAAATTAAPFVVGQIMSAAGLAPE
jgi:hypothetical protein